jgi:hypothetical protein
MKNVVQEGKVGKINWGRVVVCGFLTGMVWGALYAIALPFVDGHKIPGNDPGWPFRGTSAIVRAIVMVTPFAVGMWTMWLYAAIRPRYGPGPKTAALAGFALWFLGGWADAFWAALGAAPLGVLVGPVAAKLPIALVAAVVGAWPYRE